MADSLGYRRAEAPTILELVGSCIPRVSLHYNYTRMLVRAWNDLSSQSLGALNFPPRIGISDPHGERAYRYVTSL